ncbi:GTP-binding protein Era [Mycoplasmoides fastidiosum]|uniref:GTPase Era n=1 Tax=Mycoplasmoides fastidiosum TaxID=92758 RepID=A0ABU0LZN9_9BACT|nr:GTPase Era [Mycoplasmoides fastidiosum]MDQ0514175.1 GTP-binding protein Era [Mycoplasmoides fastidiosum]UUD37412.1 GTPase Era [Mycoplasmoides fastidiosum]
MNAKLTGNVFFCGIPNAGKSTLINRICKYEFALINSKPQTTRKESRFLYTDENHQILFKDTPGFHFAKNELDHFMNKEIYKNFRDANVVCYVCDITKQFNDEAIYFMQEVNKRSPNKLTVIFTKNDLLSANQKSELQQIKIKEISQYLQFNNYFFTSIDDLNFIDNLLSMIKYGLLTDNYIDFENEDDDNFLISETIRGVTLNLLRQEVPYGIHVQIEDKHYDPIKKLFSIEAFIYCESESKKKIIIGNKGEKIKEIGIRSRKKLNQIFDTQIYLGLVVKVSKDWRNNKNFIKKYI